MKNKDNLLQCALGVHRYDKKIEKNRFLCSICERATHYKDLPSGFENWKEYDVKGIEIHYKDSQGCEYWYEYDEQGKSNKIILWKNNKWEYLKKWLTTIF